MLKKTLITQTCLIFSFLVTSTFSLKGRCFLVPDNDSGVSGTVEFDQESEGHSVQIKVRIYGASDIHGFHLHEFGDITNGCMSTGGHYNPLNKTHGAPSDTERHVGDLGNLESVRKNVIVFEYTDNLISLYGPNSVYGRACVIHANRDDLGKGQGDSKINGNSGPRTACGILQPHNPVKSIIFGSIIVLIGLVLLVYFYAFRKTDNISNFVESEVTNTNKSF